MNPTTKLFESYDEFLTAHEQLDRGVRLFIGKQLHEEPLEWGKLFRLTLDLLNKIVVAWIDAEVVIKLRKVR